MGKTCKKTIAKNIILSWDIETVCFRVSYWREDGIWFFPTLSFYVSLVRYSSSPLEEIVSFPGRNEIIILIKSCQLSTVTVELCWTRSSGHCTAELQCSQQFIPCWRIPDHAGLCHGEFTLSCVFPSKERSISDVCSSCLCNTQQRGVDLPLGPVVLVLSAQSFRSLYVYK